MSAQGDAGRGSDPLAEGLLSAEGAANGEAGAGPGVARVARGYPGGPLGTVLVPPELAVAHGVPAPAPGPGSPARRPRPDGGGPAPAVPGLGGGRRLGTWLRRPGPEHPSVWQQAWDAWAKAGLAWQRPAGWAPEVLGGPAASGSAKWQQPAAWTPGGQLTEPMPAIRDVAPPGAGPAVPDSVRRNGATAPRTPGATAGSEPALAPNAPSDPGAGTPLTAGTGPADGSAPVTAPTSAAVPGTVADGDYRGTPELAAATEPGAGVRLDAGMGVPGGTGKEPDPAAGADPVPAPSERRGDDAAPVGAADGAAPVGAATSPGRREAGAVRRRRPVLVAAGTAVILLAAAAGGYAWVSGGAAQPSLGSLAGLPAARFADADFAPGPGAVGRAAPALTGIAGAGDAVVAFGSQPGVPSSSPLFLFSADGGRTWRQAEVGGRPGAARQGATPLMAAGGAGRWLALGSGAAWTSSDGSSWTPVPGIAPLLPGDRVLALTRSGSGFVAVGEHVGAQGGGRARTPVVWISPDGLTWQRLDSGRLRLTARGRVGALRWVTGRGNVLVVGGDVARTTAQRRGRRTITAVTDLPGTWRSTDGGAHWARVAVPTSHGASRRLGGLAATGRAFVAVRPGRAAHGRPDAVVFMSANGKSWRFAGRLAGGALRLSSVAGSDSGVAVIGSIGSRQVGFVTVGGHRWRRAGLGPAGQSVTGVTVAPGGVVVAAGVRAAQAGPVASPAPRPFLLLAGARAVDVGQRVLASAARADVVVRDLATDGRQQVAVGTAGGAPAIWVVRRGGRWARVPAGAPAAQGADLTSVVHGSAGWLAIEGDAGASGRAGTPTSVGAARGAGGAVLTSPDGRTWGPGPGAGPLAGPGVVLREAAAGRSGYVVVGERFTQGRSYAATWWSADLRAWTQTGAWPPPRGAAPSAVLAVAPTQTGFVAVGVSGARPGVWTSADGRTWAVSALPLPPGARAATLTMVAAAGRTVAALGTAAEQAGPSGRSFPFAAVSADGGRIWRELDLPTRGGRAAATALASVRDGFVAAGSQGAPGREQPVFWWSEGGRVWQAAAAGPPLRGAATRQITVLRLVGSTLTGAGYQSSPAGEHPLLWLAPAR